MANSIYDVFSNTPAARAYIRFTKGFAAKDDSSQLRIMLRLRDHLKKYPMSMDVYKPDLTGSVTVADKLTSLDRRIIRFKALCAQ